VQEFSSISNQQNNQKTLALGFNQNRSSSFFKPVIQPRLTVNSPGDMYEQEADAVADKIMRIADTDIAQTKFFKPAISPLQRKCTHCEEEEKQMQRKEMNEEETIGDNVLESYVDNLTNNGRPLSNEVRNFYEPRFGYDFTNVKVHTDTVAAKSAQSINALAYTSGNNIVFNNGQYSPNTDSGKRLLGHELTHVIQQSSDNSSHLYKKNQGLNLQRVCAQREVIPQASCGPDVSNWFISIMNSAKTHPAVLAIKSDLDSARLGGARYGYSSTDVLEGGLARRVLAAEAAAGHPRRTADASSQLGAADPHNEFGRALMGAAIPLPFAGMPEQMLLLHIRRAGARWVSMVQTGAVWDFKNTVLSAANLAGANCTNPCTNPPTVTICGTCYEHDLPGNLFYAYIGRVCGFSLNALQLGSQFAELLPTSSSNWDTPEDTITVRSCSSCSAVYPL
jgi:Domain of unknown function (DUF4157)/Bacterial toxin 44